MPVLTMLLWDRAVLRKQPWELMGDLLATMGFHQVSGVIFLPVVAVVQLEFVAIPGHLRLSLVRMVVRVVVRVLVIMLLDLVRQEDRAYLVSVLTAGQLPGSHTNQPAGAVAAVLSVLLRAHRLAVLAVRVRLVA